MDHTLIHTQVSAPQGANDSPMPLEWLGVLVVRERGVLECSKCLEKGESVDASTDRCLCKFDRE